MKWTVFSSSLLEPHNFFCSIASWARAGPWLLCGGDKTAAYAVGTLGLFHMGSLVYVTGQSGTDGSTDGSIQYEGRGWWSVDSMKGDSSGH